MRRVKAILPELQFAEGIVSQIHTTVYVNFREMVRVRPKDPSVSSTHIPVSFPGQSQIKGDNRTNGEPYRIASLPNRKRGIAWSRMPGDRIDRKSTRLNSSH